MIVFAAWALYACSPSWNVGPFELEREGTGLRITGAEGKVLVRELRFAAGDGNETLDMEAGAYRVVSGVTSWRTLTFGAARGHDPLRSFPLKAGGQPVGEVEFSDAGSGVLRVVVDTPGNR